MKRIIIGIVLLAVPTLYVFYSLVGKVGIWKTVGLFVLVIAWTSLAVELLYKGCKSLK